MQTCRSLRLLPAILILVSTVWAQETPRLDPALIEKIDRLIEAKRHQAAIPGISLAIAVDGQLTFSKGYGWSDLENSVPATAETVYRTASIAKPMTAVAVLQLAEQGKIDLDAEIQDYCPAFPAKQWPVTVRQLLAHLGGVRHYQSGQEANGTQHYFSITRALDLFKDDPLLHEPGTRYSYTTYGFNLLGCAVEGASGSAFEDYLSQNVFEPAGMTRTVVDNHFALIPHRSRGYQRIDQNTYDSLPAAAQRKVEVGAVVNAQMHDTSMKIPGGGLLSTSADLLHFALAVRAGKLVSAETVAMMWTPQQTNDGTPTRYGLGWGLGEVRGQRAVNHAGGQAGTATMLGMLPESGIAIAVMCNLQRAPVSAILDEIDELVTEAAAVATTR